jgi:hypothetical protein
MFDPLRDRAETLEAIADSLVAGKSLRESCAIAGVHVATACRWKAPSPTVKDLLDDARRDGWEATHPYRPSCRRQPRVRWHPHCPRCGAGVAVRHAFGVPGFPFWRCATWPHCPWACWRPLHPDDCPACGSARYWSYSRKSVGCLRCKLRVRITGH